MEAKKLAVGQELKQTKNRANKKTKRLWLVLSFLMVLTLGVFLFIINQFLPISQDSSLIQIEIPKGASSKTIGQILEDNQLIRNKEAFYFYVRFKGLDKDLKAGYFDLNPSWDLKQIALELTKATEAPSIKLTIPEGFNLREIGRRLEEKGLVTKEDFLKTAAEEDFNFSFLEGIPKGQQRLEGFLFPDTYQIHENATSKEIIEVMLKRFDQVFTEEMKKRAENLGLSTLELVTMASIIEKEAKLEEERPIIAGVFYNRLRAKWRLESCATIQFLLDEPKKDLLYTDLEIESPYNTYKNSGLPPGPIASPGKSSLEAALYPADVEYMFFSAEKDGSHYFSTTLAEHERETRRIANEK